MGLALFCAGCGPDRAAPTPSAADAGTAVSSTPSSNRWRPQGTGLPGVTARTPEARLAKIRSTQAAASADYFLKVADGKVRAENPAQRFDLSLDRGRAAIVELGVEFELRAVGRGKTSSQVAPAKPPKLDRGRADLQRGTNLTEWYQNGPLGLEQGFVLRAPPAGPENEPVALWIDVRGLEPVLDGKSVALRDASGQVRARYGELYALDAGGKMLPSWLEVQHSAIALRVDDRGASYPIEIDPVVWVEQQKLVPTDAVSNGWFGATVSLDGSTALVGAVQGDGFAPGSGSVSVFVRNGVTWTEQQVLVPNTGSAGAQFGRAVHVSGDTAFVADTQYGVHVFTRAAGVWSQQALLSSQSGSFLDGFGTSISSSGDVVLIGAPFDSDNGQSAGAAYLYVRNGQVWEFWQKLLAPASAGFAEFGASVSLDGDRALIGAYRDLELGSAYVFARSGNQWFMEQKLLPLNVAEIGAWFGYSVSLSGDNALIGVPNSNSFGVDSGSAHVFLYKDGNWTEKQVLTASDGGSSDAFGYSVSLSGATAVIGAPSHDHFGIVTGSAYVFATDGTAFNEQQELVPLDGNGFDNFGYSVSVSQTTALIGSYRHDSQGPDAGAAYIFFSGTALGEPCNASDECGSGFCVQNVCCHAACTGPCESCLGTHTGGGDGHCAPVLPNTDPKNLCTPQPASSCGTTGSCNGVNPTCPLHPATTVCLAASCSNPTTENPADQCDGVGTCVSTATRPCNQGYACVAGACRVNCTNDTHCSSGYQCHTASSTCRRTNGFFCSTPTDCASGFCVDGVCCATACTAACQSCNVSLKQSGTGNGTCGPTLNNTDPNDDCTDEGAASCDNNGFCDGSGACANYAAGTSCGSGSCNGTVFNASNSCNGSGTCEPSAGSTECAPHLCSPSGCQRPCTVNTNCIAGYECHMASGECRKIDGAACSLATECGSGFCVDDVCCATACTADCQACAAALKQSASGSGTCGPATNGSDPHEDCTDEGSSSCGTTGACNAGACASYPSSTQCAAGSCVSPTSQDPPDNCDGAGACVPSTEQPCNTGYACVAGACRTTCTTGAHCAGGYECHAASSTCRKIDGASCATAAECGSGFCVDEVCCATACTGECQACSAALKQGGADNGVCGSMRGGTDPRNDCEDEGAVGCGNSGMCDGAGACELYPAGTACGTGSCDGTTFTGSGSCNGSGVCTPGTTVSECAPHVCEPTGCKNPCTADDDCVAGHFCDVSGDCVPVLPDADPCTRNGECASSSCKDSVCCEQACDDPCSACSAAAKGQGEDGVCGLVVAGLDPRDDCEPDPGYPESCLADGACDGSGACRQFARLGTGCGTTACSGGLVSGDLCDGLGACQSGSEVPCDPFACSGNACGTSCSNDAQCAREAICGPAGVCVATKELGDPCEADGECNSGYCVDGVCCNAICTGQCEACDEAGSVGECVPVSSAPHGSRGACRGEGTPCAGSCDGSNPSACSYPGAATECGAGMSCDQGECTQTRAICSDSETTRPPGGTATSCAPFGCDTATGMCRTACTTTNDCASGNLCAGGSCVSNQGESAEDPGGCGCRLGPSPRPGAWSGLFVLLGLLVVRARRERSYGPRSWLRTDGHRRDRTTTRLARRFAADARRHPN